MVQFQVFAELRARGLVRARPTSVDHGRSAVDVEASQAGYVLVDALVALLIFALTLVFALQAGRQARTAAEQASEVRNANGLLTQLLETGPQQFADAAGGTDAFSWTLETRATGAERPIEVCHRQAAVTSIRTKRVYRAATLEICPLGAAA